MDDQADYKPDSTAVRVALWRALHVLKDNPPLIFKDTIGLELADPDEDWQQRPDMSLEPMQRIRAGIVSRARFIEDEVIEGMLSGIEQYVILGAGLDSFVQRRADSISDLTVFEIDKPETQNWKKQRLIELDYDIPDWLYFIPVDFETQSWWDVLVRSTFDTNKSTIIASTGVSPYITKDATIEILQKVAKLPSGSKLLMTYLLPLELVDPIDKEMYEFSIKGAKASGTPFISFYTPTEMVQLAKDVGFKNVQIISKYDYLSRYFAGRTDDFQPSSGEEFVVATT